MLTLVVIILVLLLLGGGGGFFARRSGWRPQGLIGLLIAVLLVLLLIWVVNELMMPPLPMPQGAPSIIR